MLQGVGVSNVLFVPNFRSLSDRRAIRDKLLAGEDVSVELEFNGIALSDEDRRVLALVGPVLEKVDAIVGKYSWLEGESTFSGHSCGTTRVSKDGYWLSCIKAKVIWDAASAFWGGGIKPAPLRVVEFYDVEFYDDRIEIGCRRISRLTVESIARHYGWQPNV